MLKWRAKKYTKMLSLCIQHNILIAAAAVVCLTYQSNNIMSDQMTTNTINTV